MTGINGLKTINMDKRYLDVKGLDIKPHEWHLSLGIRRVIFNKTREAEREVMQDTIKVCEKRIEELEDELKNLENAYIAELTQAHIKERNMSSSFITRVDHEKDEPYTVIFQTDVPWKYLYIENECRRMIGHSKQTENTAERNET